MNTIKTRFLAVALAAFAFLICTGCVTKIDTTTGATVTDWPSTALKFAKIAAPTLQANVKIAARMVVTHNPAHADEFQLSAAGAAALFDVASPTPENFRLAIVKVFPRIAPQDAADFADVMAANWQSIEEALQQEGVTISLTTLIRDPQYKQAADLVLGAVVTGFNDGVAAATAPKAT